LPKTLVRAFVVELVPEVIELPLLKPEVPRRRLCRLLLQRPVHPLMLAVLLRVARLNQIQLDPKVDPPS
jgi:hypothetical protein